MDKGAVTFGSSVNSRIFLIGSKPRNDRGSLGSGRRWCKHEVGSVISREKISVILIRLIA